VAAAPTGMKTQPVHWLTSATNPENGTVSYTYNGHGTYGIDGRKLATCTVGFTPTTDRHTAAGSPVR
jgi:hypothetical protein